MTIRSIHRHLMLAGGLTIVLFAAIAAATLRAYTDPARTAAGVICEGVWTTGTLIGSHSVGPVCHSEPDSSVACNTSTTGLDPKALMTVEVCLPD